MQPDATAEPPDNPSDHAGHTRRKSTEGLDLRVTSLARLCGCRSAT
jgi:hypothetical protein